MSVQPPEPPAQAPPQSPLPGEPPAITSARRKPSPQSQFQIAPRPRRGDPPRVRRETGTPYVPGFADHLLTPRAHPRPEDLRGVSLELNDHGGLVAVEHTKAGRALKSYVREFPFEVSLPLPDGSCIWIEVTRVECAAPPTAEELGSELVPCSLWEFGAEEEE